MRVDCARPTQTEDVSGPSRKGEHDVNTNTEMNFTNPGGFNPHISSNFKHTIFPDSLLALNPQP